MYRFPGCCFSAVFSVCYLCRNMLSCQYTFEGKCFCIYTRDSAQLLIVPELSSKENYWIQNQRTDLKAGEEIRHLMETYEKNKKLKDYEAVIACLNHCRLISIRISVAFVSQSVQAPEKVFILTEAYVI